jgi:hypothetical protein
MSFLGILFVFNHVTTMELEVITISVTGVYFHVMGKKCCAGIGCLSSSRKARAEGLGSARINIQKGVIVSNGVTL